MHLLSRKISFQLRYFSMVKLNLARIYSFYVYFFKKKNQKVVRFNSPGYISKNGSLLLKAHAIIAFLLILF